MSRTTVRKGYAMSALEDFRPVDRPRFHVVVAGEVSPAWRRKVAARALVRAQTIAKAKTYAAAGTVTTLFFAGVATIAHAFWSIPDTPLP